MSRAEFGKLLEVVTERWRPLVEFLVVSGCRWSEATALRPSDIDCEHGTVRGWRLGSAPTPRVADWPAKSKRSVRTINVPKSVLKRTGFRQQDRRAGSGDGFHERVWQPAVEKVWP